MYDSSFETIGMHEKVENKFISSYENKDKKLKIFVYKTLYEKCLRCWQYKEEVN